MAIDTSSRSFGSAPTAARPNPLVAAWRWRYELALAAGLGAGGWGIANATVPLWTFFFGGHIATVICLMPRVRRVLLRRAWCVVVPHRIRRACAEGGVLTRRGRLPIILWTAATPSGERVHVYCRAGISPADFHAARDVLAGTCWARDVAVTWTPGNPHLVTLDIVRY